MKADAFYESRTCVDGGWRSRTGAAEREYLRLCESVLNKKINNNSVLGKACITCPRHTVFYSIGKYGL